MANDDAAEGFSDRCFELWGRVSCLMNEYPREEQTFVVLQLAACVISTSKDTMAALGNFLGCLPKYVEEMEGQLKEGPKKRKD